ncbi:hypothetical protein J7394_00580 [Ruegeria sp. R13_0]|uniref:hypothetical protein n=1 Tax=Ruegeria sp. R13_0 TaxID=2821099 RepID=UPI001ADC0F5A|nr:hypothetical protein [Ruegeria sp. R13_0]MBO9432680.1 hypothetical protein [Ruegeria sp. R13_0]
MGFVEVSFVDFLTVISVGLGAYGFLLAPLLIVARIQKVPARRVALFLLPMIGPVALIFSTIARAERRYSEVS